MSEKKTFIQPGNGYENFTKKDLRQYVLLFGKHRTLLKTLEIRTYKALKVFSRQLNELFK